MKIETKNSTEYLDVCFYDIERVVKRRGKSLYLICTTNNNEIELSETSPAHGKSCKILEIHVSHDQLQLPVHPQLMIKCVAICCYTNIALSDTMYKSNLQFVWGILCRLKFDQMPWYCMVR